jgi:hypothetical protein
MAALGGSGFVVPRPSAVSFAWGVEGGSAAAPSSSCLVHRAFRPGVGARGGTAGAPCSPIHHPASSTQHQHQHPAPRTRSSTAPLLSPFSFSRAHFPN